MSLLLATVTAGARLSCEILAGGKITQAGASEYRAELIRTLAHSDIPAAVRVHPDGSMIPVILMSRKTYGSPEIQELIKFSMGMGVDISQGTANGNDVDHGLARSGKYYVDIIRQGDGMHIDPASGETQYGSNELNYTALRTRNWDEYMDRRNAESRVQIELAYLASYSDQRMAVAYHNLRRAGIINVVIESVLRWEKGWNVDWLDPGIKNSPRLMADGCSTVNCFTNYMGTRIPAQVEMLKQRIQAIAHNLDVEGVLHNSDLQHVLTRIQTDLTNADWRDPKILQPHFAGNDVYLNDARRVPELAGLSRDQLTDVLSYLAAIQLSREYLAVMRDQGADVFAGRDADTWDHWPRAFADKHLELDSENPRAVALFVYSESPGAPEAIRHGSFEYLGAIWGIWRNGSSPDGNRMISLQEALRRLPH